MNDPINSQYHKVVVKITLNVCVMAWWAIDNYRFVVIQGQCRAVGKILDLDSDRCRLEY